MNLGPELAGFGLILFIHIIALMKKVWFYIQICKGWWMMELKLDYGKMFRWVQENLWKDFLDCMPL